MNLLTGYSEIFVTKQTDLSPFQSPSIDSKNEFPIYSEEVYKKYIDFSNYNIKNPSKTYFIELGNNPFPFSGPRPGSILVIEKDRQPLSGQLVLAWLEGEFVVRRYLIKNVYPRLVCENEDYPDVEIEPDMEFWVWGVVTDFQPGIL